jgi:hypothetical protein
MVDPSILGRGAHVARPLQRAEERNHPSRLLFTPSGMEG